jgi:hypothetical protein
MRHNRGILSPCQRQNGRVFVHIVDLLIYRKIQESESFQTILKLAEPQKKPVFVSIDDTVIPKTKPSSKAKRPTEGTGWHYSHLEGKVVYEYQVHAAIVSTRDTTLCYSLKRYDKERATKIDMIRDIIESIPDQAGAYFLMDSWYTNPDIVHTCEKKGCFLIGAMKTNRILYPNGQKTSAMDYAKCLLPDQFHSVVGRSRSCFALINAIWPSNPSWSELLRPLIVCSPSFV